MAVNLKVDPNDRIWLLWSSSVRVEKHPNQDKTVGRVRLNRMPNAPVNIDSMVSLPSNVKLSAVPQQAGKAARSDDSVQTSVCFSCGRTVLPSRKHQLLYKTVILHFEQLLSVLGVRSDPQVPRGGFGSGGGGGSPFAERKLQWPPQPDVVAALGGVGLGGYYGPLGPKSTHNDPKKRKKKRGQGGEDAPPEPTAEDLEIPPVLRLLHPQLALHDYRTYRNDPLFLYKSTPVCEDCFLVYAETASAHLEPSSVSSAVLTQHTGLHHPLEHADRRAMFHSKGRLSPLSGRHGRSGGGGHGGGQSSRGGQSGYGDPSWEDSRGPGGGSMSRGGRSGGGSRRRGRHLLLSVGAHPPPRAGPPCRPSRCRC